VLIETVFHVLSLYTVVMPVRDPESKRTIEESLGIIYLIHTSLTRISDGPQVMLSLLTVSVRRHVLNLYIAEVETAKMLAMISFIFHIF